MAVGVALAQRKVLDHLRVSDFVTHFTSPAETSASGSILSEWVRACFSGSFTFTELNCNQN